MILRLLFVLFGLASFSLIGAQENTVTENPAPVASTPTKRTGSARPYEPLDALAKRMKSRPYSQYENATGIFFNAGETIEIEISETHGEKVELLLQDFNGEAKEQKFTLITGKNTFTAGVTGLTYISYYSPNFKTAKPLTYNFTTGAINGVFRDGDDNATWEKLLNAAVAPHFDLVGKYVHLVFPVADLKKYSNNKGKEVLARYDEIMSLQREMMGMYKYQENTPNRQFGRVVYRGYMFADNIGSGFNNQTMNRLTNPKYLYQHGDTIWGIAHEFGHTNQMRPTMCWAGTTEVTNNLFSAWTNYLLHPQSQRLEREVCDDGDGYLAGGRYNAFFHSALMKNENWLFQPGPDTPNQNASGSTSGSGDFFVRLIPMWQLHLYYHAARKTPLDLYPDLYQKARYLDEKDKHAGDFQIAFMRNCMDITQENLVPFFVRVGMLKPVDREIADYGNRRITISKEQCDELIAYGAKYPAPKSPVIYYLSVNCLDAYKNEKPVGGFFAQGVTPLTGRKHPAFKIEHNIWKNVAVFETYKNNELLRVAMVGAGFPDNSATSVLYPDGATRIEAVAWNGAKTLVYGKREN